jgi:glycosyltransferase involved in cell wall biosynthesis
VLGYRIDRLQYFVELLDGRSSQRYSVTSPGDLLSLAAHSEVRQVIYNCAVSYRHPLSVIDTLIALKQRTGCELLLAVHDYFMICPSQYLIDKNGRFCGVPSGDTCRPCLHVHPDRFVSLSGERSIDHWRQEWSRLLAVADEVRLFSEASRRLLKSAYPFVNDAAWRVRPHILHTRTTKVIVDVGAHLHVGVIGAIGKHKGSEIVSGLATEIVRRNSNAKITVIGTIDAKVPGNVVSVTGTYEPRQLPELIRKSGANIFLFPSIWAETFSYVSHELVAMELPFACFDFGAPSDLARSYDRGLVLRSMSPDSILDELENYWRETNRIKELTTA